MHAVRLTLLSIVSLLLPAFGFPLLPSIAAAAEQPVVTITMGDDLRFSPASVTIKPGTRVRWINRSFIRHTVTADPTKAARPADVALPKGAKPFDSGFIDNQGTYEHIFTVSGQYRYFCIPHETTGMVAEIIVEE